MNNSLRNPAKKFLGVGWSFPVCVQPDGRIDMAAYEEDVAEAIRIILGTNPGERVMRPDFGSGLNAFVFEPINQTTVESLKKRVRDALVDWEPRIDVEQVDVTPDKAEHGKLNIEIRYRVRTSNAVRNLVYPFYFEEGK